MKWRYILFFVALCLVGADTALAINVPDGTFDEHDVGDGLWSYVNNVAGHDWISESTGGGTPWIGNNYGNGYPTMGHTGAQFIDMNSAIIHQTLSGKTYEEGVDYKLSMYVTTTYGGQVLDIHFLDGDDWENPLASQSFDVAIEADMATWSKYSFMYTATPEDHGKPIGIAFWGGYNTWSDTVTLTSGEPEITSDPVDIVVDETRTAVFTVEHLNGTSYKWRKVGTGVVDSGTATSGQTITLPISGVTQADEGYYYCKVINDKVPDGVDSAQAQLTVTTLTCGDWGRLRSDINRDCYVNLLDLVELAAKWLNGPSH